MNNKDSNIENLVEQLVEPVLVSQGLELDDVSYAGGVLLITVDTDGGVSSSQLVETSRTLSPLLDQHEVVPGRYVLEVSSPGIERRLRKSRHFQKALGETVKVKLHPGSEARRVVGKLSDFLGAESEGTATIVVDVAELDGSPVAGETRTMELSLANIDTVRTVFEWPEAAANNKHNKKSKTSKQKQKQKK